MASQSRVFFTSFFLKFIEKQLPNKFVQVLKLKNNEKKMNGPSIF